MTIFVSHASTDGDAVRSLVSALNAAGSRVWLDQDLTGGEAWWTAILRQIRECSVFVFALSENSLESEACLLELGYARDLGRPILPVQIGDVHGLRDHAIFAYQAIDYRNPTAATGIALVRAIHEREREVQPLPDPLPAPPAMPYEYLMLLGTAIQGRQPISPDDQESIVKQLRQALREERNPAILDNVRRLLTALRERPEVTFRTVNEVNELLAAPVVTPPAKRPAAGWYPDALDASLLRYWDGEQWTQHTRPLQAQPADPAQPGHFAPQLPPGNTSKVFSIIAFVFAGLALVIPLLGLIGIGCGVAAHVRKEKQGTQALIVAAAVTVGSWILWSFINTR